MMVWCPTETYPDSTEMWINLKLAAAIDQTNNRILLIDGTWYTVTGDFQSITDALEGCDL